MHRLARVMETIAGAMLAASGVYLILYWLPRVLDTEAAPGGSFGEVAEKTSSVLTGFLAAHTGAFAIGLAVTAAAAAALRPWNGDRA